MSNVRLCGSVLALTIAAALGLGGCYQGMNVAQGASVPQLQAEQEKARNATLVSNMRTLQMAIEEYSVDHNGRYPDGLQLVSALTAVTTGTIKLGYYLPGSLMPANPWSTEGFHQANSLSTAGLQPLLAPAGMAPTPVGTALGQGKPATSATFDARTYGALIYDFDPKTQTYTLYAIGKQGDRAAVVAHATNAGY